MLRNNDLGSNSLYRGLLAGLLLASAGAVTACEAPESREDLNPAGPPMVRQVLVTERLLGESGNQTIAPGQLAFGTHGDKFFENDDGEVLTAFALGNQEIRVVLDELIRGNALEEIACADGTYSRVPVGTDPDDISDCAGPVDSLLKCDTVCLDPNSGTPIGILDINEDGAPDAIRMIDYNPDPDITELAVTVTCDGVVIPLDPENSFWNPSGNQTFPSNDRLSYKGLGPAIVVRPVGTIGMRTSSSCSVAFHPDVVDHDGNQICAPTNGDITADCTGGDTTKIAFSTEPLRIASNVPDEDQCIALADEATCIDDRDCLWDGSSCSKDEDENPRLEDSAFMSIAFNANVDGDTVVAAVTLTAAGAPVTMIPTEESGEFVGDDGTLISYRLADDFVSETEYELTVTTDLTDRLGGPFPATQVITWTTEPFQFDDSEPEDGDTDVAAGLIELEFNAPVNAATLAAITVTKDGTRTMDGTAAPDGVAVAFTATVNAMDNKIVNIDLGNAAELDTYYEVVLTTALQDIANHGIKSDAVVGFTSAAAFEFANSSPASGAADVAVAGGNLVLNFNVAVDPVTVAAAITATAGGAAAVITATVQADGRQVIVNFGANFAATEDYVVTIGTGLQEAGGAALAAAFDITWTTL